MLNVGITGGIGSGKTTCCKIFEGLGIPVYYSDDRAKDLMWRSKTLKASIKEILGNKAYHRNGRLNKPFVASKIFTNKKLLEKVNAVVHPAVGLDGITWMSGHLDKPYTLKEAALLVENGSYKMMNKLIVVTAPEEMRIDRVMNRDKVSREQVLARVQKQLPEEEKIKCADYIIINDGKHSLLKQIAKIHTLLIQLNNIKKK